MDSGSATTFDLSYYSLLLKRRGLFVSDLALTTSSTTRTFITQLVQGSQKNFFAQFAKSMEKMGLSTGEIRKVCAFVNSKILGCLILCLMDKFLFEKPISVLSWEQRFNLIKGVASGLFYLHEEYEQIVIHRDIKAGNVLLDADLNGRVGDFGMAKLYEHGENPTTTRVVGTLGYLAPELPRTGRTTTSSDVFAFGALLLEVVCGRRPIENKAPPEEFVLVDWVWDKGSLNSDGTQADADLSFVSVAASPMSFLYKKGGAR